MQSRKTRTVWFSAVVMMLSLSARTSHSVQSNDGELVALRAELEEMRTSYEQRITELEARLAAIEAGPVQSDENQELAALRMAAAAMTSESSTPANAASVTSMQRNLNRYNPEISATGVILGSIPEGGSSTIEAHEFELDLQSALDPFSKMRLTIAFADGDAEIEEGFIRYDGIGGGLSVEAGRFRQSFGAINRQHLHALPQVDYPMALSTVFGEEGLVQTGLSATWLMPGVWADANELTVQLTTGDNEAFSGADLNDPAVLAHFKNYWEFNEATWFELGLSGIVGTAAGGDSEVFGADLTFHWQPPSRAKYRELTWRTEILRSRREIADIATATAWGGYSYIEGLVAQNLSVGLLIDLAEDPVDPESESWRVAPYISWWQSEYVRLRLEGRYTSRDALPDDHFEAVLQLTFAAGPHKHENY